MYSNTGLPADAETEKDPGGKEETDPEEVKTKDTKKKEKKTKLPEAKLNLNTLFTYTVGCSVNLLEGTTVSINWDNGAAIGATRGASMDYVPAHFFVHVTEDFRHYGLAEDYAALVIANVDTRLAWVICMIREVVFSMSKVEVNISECVIANDPYGTIDIDQKVITMMKEKGPALTSVIQQSLTILALNGASLVSRGHHYREDDRMWARFEAATSFEENMTTLGISNYSGAIFHDALHPFDYDWIATLASNPASELRTSVNGVALRRLGTLPAGTTVLGLIEPLINEVRIRSALLADVLEMTLPKVKEMIATVRRNPLKFCIHLPRHETATNLQAISTYEPIVAIMYGYLKALGVKGTTTLQAKSLQNIAQRNSAAYGLGAKCAQAFPLGEDAMSPAEAVREIASMLDLKIPVSMMPEVKPEPKRADNNAV
jgi:hypothetical protein